MTGAQARPLKVWPQGHPQPVEIPLSGFYHGQARLSKFPPVLYTWLLKMHFQNTIPGNPFRIL